jgi:monoamine oxidase
MWRERALNAVLVVAGPRRHSLHQSDAFTGQAQKSPKRWDGFFEGALLTGEAAAKVILAKVER